MKHYACKAVHLMLQMLQRIFLIDQLVKFFLLNDQSNASNAKWTASKNMTIEIRISDNYNKRRDLRSNDETNLIYHSY